MLSKKDSRNAAMVIFIAMVVCMSLLLFTLNHEPAPKVYNSTPTRIPSPEKSIFQKTEEVQGILDGLDFTKVFKDWDNRTK